MHKSSFDKMRAFRQQFLAERESRQTTILDLGSMDVCSNFTYRELFDQPQWQYIGVDMAEGENVDVVLKNPYSWKEIDSQSVDVFISGQAFEHVEYTWILMLEVHRVLRPGGIACIIAPSGGFEHRYPVDCWRFYPDGFAALSKFARMDVLETYTQWDSEGYADDNSDIWRDSVLICQKPSRNGWAAFRDRLINRLQHRITSYRLADIVTTETSPNETAKDVVPMTADEIQDLDQAIRASQLPPRDAFEQLLAAYGEKDSALVQTQKAFDDLQLAYGQKEAAFEQLQGAYAEKDAETRDLRDAYESKDREVGRLRRAYGIDLDQAR